MNNNLCRLSIIVPVYNVQDTLVRCVNSLYEQGMDKSEFEVILINDGSTDNSFKIAQDLERRYNNLKLISQKNQGLGGARNTGILASSGKYLTFVDSDDYLVPQKLNGLLKICEDNDLDVLRFKKVFITFSGERKPNILSGINFNHIYSGKEAFLYFVGSACASIFKTSIFTDNNLFFTKGITQEDVEFTTRFFTKVRRVMAVDDVAYICMYNDQSLSRNKNLDKQNKYVCDSVLVASLGIQYAKNNVSEPEMQELIIKRSNSAIMGHLINFIRRNEYPQEIVENFINYAQELEVIPIKGKTLSRYTNILLPLAKHPSLFKIIYNISKLFKKKSSK